MSADLAIQKALRTLLVTAPAVTAVVPVNNIMDRNASPAPRPSIVFGETQILDGGGIARDHWRVFHTLHFWFKEPGKAQVKWAMEAARKAILASPLDLSPDWHCVDRRIESVRSMTDPDGETSHGVLVVNVLAEEIAP